MRGPNFTQCAIDFLTNDTNIRLYAYNGPTRGIAANASTQITYHGCLALCGSGSEYYNWYSISNTMLTWVLPILGIILQAPFEPHAIWSTGFALARWIGSPMACLAYSLWNINVISTSAKIVDLAIPANIRIPDDGTDFSSIRNSFFILTVMNSFTMKPSASLKREAEGLLRMVLFSKDLRLKGTDMTLDQHRCELARMLRIFRKRGVVPAFISTMWFWFAMAVSIQQAFGMLGQNAEAHDLALGLLLAWVPVLILCSVVDRDFVSGEEVRVRLNNLINLVIDALADDEIRQEYKDGLHDMHDAAQMGVWLDSIVRQTKETNMKDFFLDYAGQGRVRYHYGAAHPILCDIERSYIVARGRAWMTNEREARYSLVLGKIGGNLIWFDFNELWQIAFGIIIVTGTILGAFTLSFFTPTVGLGCRSGGYLIFWVVSFVLLLTELVLWYLTTPTGWNDTLHKTMSRTISRYEELRLWIRRHTRRFFSLVPRGLTLTELAYYRTTRFILRAFCVSQEVLDRREKRRLRNIEYRNAWSLNDWAHFSFFRPIESLNAIWLTYIVAAQTVGSYETCECQTSNWGAGGGYLDFTQFNVSNAPWLIYIWAVSTVIALVAMGIPMIYITTEWCLISHLSTEDYDRARRGLRRARQFRRLGYPLRLAVRAAMSTLRWLATTCFFLPSNKRAAKSVVWTYDITSPLLLEPEPGMLRRSRPLHDVTPPDEIHHARRGRGAGDLFVDGIAVDAAAGAEAGGSSDSGSGSDRALAGAATAEKKKAGVLVRARPLLRRESTDLRAQTMWRDDSPADGGEGEGESEMVQLGTPHARSFEGAR